MKRSLWKLFFNNIIIFFQTFFFLSNKICGSGGNIPKCSHPGVPWIPNDRHSISFSTRFFKIALTFKKASSVNITERYSYFSSTYFYEYSSCFGWWDIYICFIYFFFNFCDIFEVKLINNNIKLNNNLYFKNIKLLIYVN